MKPTDLVIRSALAGLLAAGIAAGAGAAADEPAAKEKCFGIAKAGKNDCHSAKNMCAGSIKTDNEPYGWKWVEKGTCEKVGGKLISADAEQPKSKE
jgi:uncharacterized membrane protein